MFSFILQQACKRDVARVMPCCRGPKIFLRLP